jgi:hypothetical protein
MRAASVEQRPGVAGVAAHRRVAPHLVAVPVEPQVQEHQPLHVVDDLVGEPQRPQPVAGHAGADHLVVVEAHALGPDRAGLGLAHVVQQRGEPQHQPG